jgi:hypothetical protein
MPFVNDVAAAGCLQPEENPVNSKLGSGKRDASCADKSESQIFGQCR